MICKTNLNLENILSVHSGWYDKFVTSIGSCSLDKDIFLFPEDMASGKSLFCKILPELAVVVMDLQLRQTLNLSQIPAIDNSGFWVLCFDLQNERFMQNSPEVNELEKKVSLSKVTLLDGKTGSSFIVQQGDSIFSLRILIKKAFFKEFIKNKDLEKEIKVVLNSKGFLSKTIDSRSRVILNNLRSQNLDSSNYEFLIKGVVYRLLVLFNERRSVFSTNDSVIYERDRKMILSTNDFLMSNLTLPFPGNAKLVEISNMSVTKYRILYKNIVGTTPFLFFREKKLLLAKEMLNSGNFKRVTDVAFALGYNKVAYFSQIYKREFNISPCDSLYASNSSNRSDFGQ